MNLFTKSTQQQLDKMDAEATYQYLVQNVEREDAVLIIQNQIASKEDRKQQLSIELQEPGISLQRSIEIAQERKSVLDCIDRLKKVSDMLMADVQQQAPCKDKPNVPVNISQESLVPDTIPTVDIQNPPIEESHATVQAETNPETSVPEVQAEGRKKLSGWGSFFQVAVGFGILGTIISLIFGLSLAKGLVPSWMLGLELVALLCYAILGIMVILSFQLRDPKTVFLAKSYSTLFAFNYIAGALSGTLEPSKAIGASIVGGAWFAYLTYSKNIIDVFPVEQRSTSLTTKLVIAGLGVLILADHVTIGWYVKSVLQ